MLRTALNEALKTAMLAKETRAVSTVRLILAALKDRDIAARSKGNMDGISEDDILSMLQSMIKQRKESISLYEQGGRLELAQQEQEEIGVIERFLPKQMSAEESEAAIKAALAEVEAKGLKDMGRVMTALRERHAGQMDFGKASALVKSLLS
ncbi:MAG: GatB/YqeY domain-containing protein [Rhodospirillales bacterium]|nr:GatB/YqeY domain-containing protein [Rhodospirillales bacterium]